MRFMLLLKHLDLEKVPSCSKKKLTSMLSAVRSILCAILYGVMENRLFFEGHEDEWLLSHFKTYHLFMFLLFAVIAFDPHWPSFLWSFLAMPLAEDATWQLIERRQLKQEDWSNIGGFKLLLGVYVWYWVDAFFLIVLGLFILLRGC